MLVGFEDGGAGGRAPGSDGVRSVKTASWRGWRGRCPRCGVGPLFERFLKVAPKCSVCGEAFHHHRADDLPPYLTILIVGHVVVSGLLLTERLWAPAAWIEGAIWLPVTAGLALALLQPIKGAVVGLQWALGMHGFAAPAKPTDPARDSA